MDQRTARRVLVVAAIAGVIADLLFDREPLGLGVPLSVVAALACVAIVSLVPANALRRGPVDRVDWWLPAAAVIASLGPVLRTDPTVVFLDLVLVGLAMAAWSVALSGVAVTRRTGEAVAALGATAGLAMLAAPAWLVRSMAGEQAFASLTRRMSKLAPLARGVVIAVPVVAGFAFLLGSADAVFGHVIDDAFRFSLDLHDVTGRVAFVLIAAAVACGPIAVAAGVAGSPGFPIGPFAPPAPTGEAGPQPTDQPAGARTGTTEAIVVLVAVDLLFAAFAAVQVVFLFGGTDTLAAIGMTYSDYARQGYFQLVGVVALAGLLVIGAHHAVGRTRAFVGAALVLLLLTAVILVSAAVRMGFYQGAFGWTELRFYVVASIGWLGLSLVAAVVLLASARMRWLPHALAMSAVGVTLVVSAIGPQAFVMQENVARVLDPGRVAPGGHPGLDLEYGLSLGDDAIPALVDALPALPTDVGSSLQAELLQRYRDLRVEAREAGPLSWNLARDNALVVLRSLFDDGYGVVD